MSALRVGAATAVCGHFSRGCGSAGTVARDNNADCHQRAKLKTANLSAFIHLSFFFKKIKLGISIALPLIVLFFVAKFYFKNLSHHLVQNCKCNQNLLFPC
jgi:predicted secreted protein